MPTKIDPAYKKLQQRTEALLKQLDKSNAGSAAKAKRLGTALGRQTAKIEKMVATTQTDLRRAEASFTTRLNRALVQLVFGKK